MVDWTHIIVALVTGCCTAATTLAVLRNDVKWIRRTLESHITDDSKRFDRIADFLEGYSIPVPTGRKLRKTPD